jgi:hypothetical protein
MKLRDFIAILLGLKKPALVPVPKNNQQQKR